MNAVARRFPAASRQRIKHIEARNLAMDLARTFQRLGMPDGVAHSARLARAEQHHALRYSRAVMR